MLKNNRKGAMSIEIIIGIILAVVVLLTVLLFFTGAFEKATEPIGGTLSAIECKGYCQAENKEAFDRNNCGYVLAKLGDTCPIYS